MAFPRTLPSPPWLERILASGRRLLPTRLRGDVPLVPVVRLSGTIGFSTPLRPGLTLAGLARTLDRAFAYRHAKAVALVINSPGGSAVQSHLIHGRIRQLSQAKGVPVIAFTGSSRRSAWSGGSIPPASTKPCSTRSCRRSPATCSG